MPMTRRAAWMRWLGLITWSSSAAFSLQVSTLAQAPPTQTESARAQTARAQTARVQTPDTQAPLAQAPLQRGPRVRAPLNPVRQAAAPITRAPLPAAPLPAAPLSTTPLPANPLPATPRSAVGRPTVAEPRATAGPQPANGQPANGQPANGQPANGQPANGQPGGVAEGAGRALPDVAVVCPEEWRGQLKDWVAYRERQGHVIAWILPGSTQQIQQELAELAQGEHRLRYLVLIGDVPSSPAATGRTVATYYIPGPLTKRFGSTATIASDTPYTQLDDDLIPDLAVGRIPVDSAAELRAVADKILAYEGNSDFGLWRRQINLTAGTGGFGPVIDTAVEMAAKSFITQRIPAAYQTDLCYANWRSPYCAPFNKLQATAIDQLRGGAAAWVFMGHGLPDYLATVGPDGSHYPVLSNEMVQQLTRCPQPPVALILACYALAYDARVDCLGEQLLKAPGGPVAVIGGTRVTMPYGLSILSMGLLENWFEHRAPTVGDLMLAAKQQLADPKRSANSTQWLDALAMVFHPQRDQLAQERTEHLHLMQLLGDPLLSLHHPESLEIHAEEEVASGQVLTVRGETHFAGQATVELVCRRDRFTFEPPTRTEWEETIDGNAEMEELRRRANNPRWNAVSLPVEPGAFEVRLLVPAEALGPGNVRVFVEGDKQFAIAAAALTVTQGESEPRSNAADEPEISTVDAVHVAP